MSSYGCGGRIRTCDLLVMSQASYLTAPPRYVDRNRDETSIASELSNVKTELHAASGTFNRSLMKAVTVRPWTKIRDSNSHSLLGRQEC